MPNDVKAIVSAAVIVVATAIFMVIAMWIFPEAGVKKGDLKSRGAAHPDR